MAKKKEEKQARKYTRHQLARWQQQKKRQRLFLMLGIGIIAVVGGVVGTGWYRDEYQPMHEVVIQVNETEFDMGYYVDTLKVSGAFYQQVYGDSDPSTYMPNVASQAVTAIQERELIRQGADSLGITVSDEEVNEELRKNDPPLGDEYRDLVRADMIRRRLLDDYFEEKVPEDAEQRQVMAMLLESENQAAEVKKRIEDGEGFTELAGELAVESLIVNEDGEAGWYTHDILADKQGFPVVADYAFGAGMGLSDPIYDKDRTKDVGYWVVKLVDTDEDEQGELYKVQAMLLGSEQEAQDAIERLESGADGDFAEIAAELSQDTESREDGGDLGWLGEEEIAEPLRDFVLAAEPEEVSWLIRDEGVVTDGGYWLVDVLGIEQNRPISDGDRDFLKRRALDEWISSLWDDPENVVESYLDEEKTEWAIDKATGG